MSNVRKAFVSKGDDCTLTRFVKVPVAPTKPKQLWLPDMRHKALENAHSIFTRKGVRPPGDSVLVSGHSNVKIGRDVRKGKFKGYWIYTLTLEERATCPRSCHHWQDCYGNNMPWAKRVDHSDHRALCDAIEADINRLLSVRGRTGILVRLHALGDFYSVQYVEFWRTMLALHPRLAIYGYTARRDDEIARSIALTKSLYPDRFRIRWSDGEAASDCTVSIENASQCPPDAFVCPEQTGRVGTCAQCGACWSGDKNVAFLAH